MIDLSLRSISKSYDGLAALRDVSLDVAAGTRCVVVGPSASGKTTLLRIIAGFETADRGEVVIGGECLSGRGVSMPAHRRGIGYVAQDGALFPHLTVAGNIGFGLARNEAGRENRIRELLDLVELPASALERRPDQLSGGQQQRVALARALAQRPRLMLLDEPFSALDSGLREATRKAIGKILSEAGITSVLVTHDQAEALAFADQVAVLNRGQLLQAGPPRELYATPVSPEVARYLGDAIIQEATLGDCFAECALGRVRTKERSRRGSASVLLRPEQIRLTGAGSDRQGGDAGSDERAATVVDVDFAGAYCSVTLELAAEAGVKADPVVVRTQGAQQLSRGDEVWLTIDGIAHVFPERG
ncbi:MAG: ABC transporter ATP-binding protein [Proteobacteria bacterium]|nr:ABC transporter ATP-binding protein [Pseudomonadota bacterium]